MTKTERAKEIILEFARNNYQFTHANLWKECEQKFFEGHIGRKSAQDALAILIATDKKIFSMGQTNANGEQLYGLWES